MEAGRRLFGCLRWAEAVPGATRVLIADVAAIATAAGWGDSGAGLAVANGEHAASVGDRAFRAASGRVLPLGALPPRPSVP